MAERGDVRPGEVALELPAAYDASVYFIGRIRTPFKSRAECPRNTAESNAVGRVELDVRFAAGLAGPGPLPPPLPLFWLGPARARPVPQGAAPFGRPPGPLLVAPPG